MCVGGVLLRLTGAKNSVLPTVRRSLWALPLSLTRAEGESDGVKGRGSNCGDVRKREGNGERERESQSEKTNRTEAAVCVRSAGSFRMFYTAVKTPGGLSAPGAVIYHQSGEAGPPLWPVQ